MKYALIGYASEAAPKGRQAVVVVWVPHVDPVRRAAGKWEPLSVFFYAFTVEKAKERAREFMRDAQRKARENRVEQYDDGKMKTGSKHILPPALVDAYDDLVEATADAVIAQSLSADIRDGVARLETMHALEGRRSSRMARRIDELQALADKLDMEDD